MLVSRYIGQRKMVLRSGSTLLRQRFGSFPPSRGRGSGAKKKTTSSFSPRSQSTASSSPAEEWPAAVDVFRAGPTGTAVEQQEIVNCIKQSSALPSVVYLYDDLGSDLFEEITATPEYYLTRTELRILSENASEMARFRDEQRADEPRGFQSSLIELGAGSGQKLHPLLDALERIPKSAHAEAKCTYLPADFSESSLEMNLNIFNGSRKTNVQAFQGTHEEALRALHTRGGRKTWAYLGSSLGNYADPVPFLRNLAAHCGPRDRILLGLDLAATVPATESSTSNDKRSKPVHVIEQAYNDAAGITSAFILNSLSVVNRIAGLDFNVNNFRLKSEYNLSTDAVEMSAECIAACNITDSQGRLVRSFAVGDCLFIEQSGKFTESKIQNMLRDAGLVLQRRWSDEKEYFSIIELAPDLPGIATRQSQFIFKDLIGEDNLPKQPLQLRNPFAFYWGHISAFSDRMALALPGRQHEREIFERGVDPNVDDPTKIHRHSPRFQQTWPSVDEFETYDLQVEKGLQEKIAETGVSRSILMSLEHAEMHHETLMYMVLQMDNRLRMELTMEMPQEESYSHPFSPFDPSPETERGIPEGACVRVESTQVELGASQEKKAACGFVWDNEMPHKVLSVASFDCHVCPVTNAEFKDFVEDGGYKHAEFWEDNEINDKVRAVGGSGSWDWIQRENIERPLFWTIDKQGIRSLDRVVPFQDAKNWPAIVSLFEAAAFCRWLGNSARVMTEAEYHALFAGKEDFNAVAARGNNNWRFRYVVPVGTMEDATAKGIHDLVGNGWEWTSTVFDGFEGFQPMHDYQEYSADFFDGKHFVVKGASPYTGKLVQRMSFRNWYQ